MLDQNSVVSETDVDNQKKGESYLIYEKKKRLLITEAILKIIKCSAFARNLIIYSNLHY